MEDNWDAEEEIEDRDCQEELEAQRAAEAKKKKKKAWYEEDMI